MSIIRMLHAAFYSSSLTCLLSFRCVFVFPVPIPSPKKGMHEVCSCDYPYLCMIIRWSHLDNISTDEERNVSVVGPHTTRGVADHSRSKG